MAAMEYRTIPYVDKKVSRIFYGTAMDPFFGGEEGVELLDEIFALGVNAFDTARVYQMSEKVLGKWMSSRKNRDEVVLLSKCGHPDQVTWRKRINEKEIREDFAVSSDLLQTDYIDIYLMHRDDPEVPVGEIVEIFHALHEEGKIGAYGGSNWTTARIQEANEYATQHNLLPMTVSSPNYGLADQVRDLWGGGSVTISGPSNEKAREWYIKNQMPVIAYSSLAHGFFSGRLKSCDAGREDQIVDAFAVKGYSCPENFERLRRAEELAEKHGCTVSEIAMAFIYGQQVNTFAIVSTSSPERMQKNIDAMSLGLTKEELDYLDLK